MPHCAACTLELDNDRGLCPHHDVRSADQWAASNKIWCDYFHRRIPIPRLTKAERDEEVWAYPGEAADAA